MCQHNRMGPRGFAIFVCVLFLLQCRLSHSQNSFELSDDPATEAEGLIARIRPLLIESQVQAKDVDIAQNVNFIIDKEDPGIKIAARKSKKGARQVIFSLGAVLALRKVNESFADIFCCYNGMPSRASIHSRALGWGGYMSTVGFHVNKGNPQAISELGQQLSDYPSYCEKTMMPARGINCTAFEEQPNFKIRFKQAQFSTYAFIMGHELTHHLFGQVRGEPFFNKKGNELMADRRGLAFVGTAGGQIVEALNALILLSTIEAFGDPGDEIHPRPLCRIVQALHSPEADSIADPGFARHPASEDEARHYEEFAIKERLLENAAEELRERADPQIIHGIGDRARLQIADKDCLQL
jgi:hypothetical protein